MTKQLSALLWLRGRILLTNKAVLLQVIMPLLFPIMYGYMAKMNDMSMEQVWVFLAMAIMMGLALGVGNPILVILSEEKEKRTLNTLLVSGVGYSEYILSTLIYPIILSIVFSITFPMIMGVDLMPQIFNYFVVMTLTSLAIILLFLLLGFLVSTQVAAQVAGVIAVFTIFGVSAAAGFVEIVGKIAKFTFMGLFNQLFYHSSTFVLLDHKLEIASAIIWIIALIVLNRLFITRSKMK